MEVEMPQKLGVGGVKKENKLKQEQRKKGQQYAIHFFFVGGLVYVHGLCDGKFWNIRLLCSVRTF